MTTGGSIIYYEGNTKAPIDDLITIKLLLNSALSTPGAKFMTIDRKKLLLKNRATIKSMHVHAIRVKTRINNNTIQPASQNSHRKSAHVCQ